MQCCSCVHLFRADHLGLDNPSRNSSLEKHWFSLSWQPFIAYSPSCKDETLWIFLPSQWHAIFRLVWTTMIVEITCVQFPCPVQKILSRGRQPDSLALTIFLSLFSMIFPEPWVWHCSADVSDGAGTLQSVVICI